MSLHRKLTLNSPQDMGASEGGSLHSRLSAPRACSRSSGDRKDLLGQMLEKFLEGVANKSNRRWFSVYSAFLKDAAPKGHFSDIQNI